MKRLDLIANWAHASVKKRSKCLELRRITFNETLGGEWGYSDSFWPFHEIPKAIPSFVHCDIPSESPRLKLQYSSRVNRKYRMVSVLSVPKHERTFLENEKMVGLFGHFRFFQTKQWVLRGNNMDICIIVLCGPFEMGKTNLFLEREIFWCIPRIKSNHFPENYDNEWSGCFNINCVDGFDMDHVIEEN